MVLTIKKQFFFYKKFEIDIWGLMKTNLNLNPSLYDDLSDLVIKDSLIESYAPLTLRGYFTSEKHCYDIPILSKRLSRFCGFFWHLSNLRRQKTEAQFGRYIYRLDELVVPKVRKRARRKVMASLIVKLFYLIYNSRQFKRLAQKAFKKSGSFSDNYLCLLEGRLCLVVYRAGFFANLFDALKFTKQGYVCVDGLYQSSMYFYIKPIQMLSFNPVVKGTILWFLLRRLNRAMALGCTPKYMYISYTFLYFFWKRIPKGRELINPTGIDMLRVCNYDYYF
jgi:ribosomal protein S4